MLSFASFLVSIVGVSIPLNNTQFLVRDYNEIGAAVRCNWLAQFSLQ